MLVFKSAALFFFFNDTATTEIYTLSLHDALPIPHGGKQGRRRRPPGPPIPQRSRARGLDRKSTRLYSSHDQISYAVFCLKKKNIPCISDRATWFMIEYQGAFYVGQDGIYVFCLYSDDGSYLFFDVSFFF